MGTDELPEHATPIDSQLYDELLNPLAAAVAVAFQEVAKTEVILHASFCLSTAPHDGDRSASINLNLPAGRGYLVLSVSASAADELANRILADQNATLDSSLIDDCLGELANVIAGQGKAMLYGTAWHYTFGTPRVAASSELPPDTSGDANWYILHFQSDVGLLSLQVAIPH